jgi:hypothetical protein
MTLCKPPSNFALPSPASPQLLVTYLPLSFTVHRGGNFQGRAACLRYRWHPEEQGMIFLGSSPPTEFGRYPASRGDQLARTALMAKWATSVFHHRLPASDYQMPVGCNGLFQLRYRDFRWLAQCPRLDEKIIGSHHKKVDACDNKCAEKPCHLIGPLWHAKYREVDPS